jgi:hypothetical protein
MVLESVSEGVRMTDKAEDGTIVDHTFDRRSLGDIGRILRRYALSKTFPGRPRHRRVILRLAAMYSSVAAYKPIRRRVHP